jgi:exodeoxyribonuclease VIII
VHTALFEPDQVVKRYAVRPADLDGRTKKGQEWIADAEGRGLIVITAAQEAAALAQARAVRALPDVAALLAEGMAEVSAFWIDAETSELCKCRPDWVAPVGDGVILIDGKTCQDASPDGFGRAIWNFAYHLQAAWYSDGYEAATGQRVHGFVFAAVESAWPHPAAAYMLGDDVLDKARAENRRLLNLYAECKRTGTWPGYPAGISHINLPRWANLETTE